MRLAGRPSTFAWNTSGYFVGEWLPQMVMWVISVTPTPSLGRELADGAVVVEPRHRGEAIRGLAVGVALRDERVGVRRVADHEDPDVVGRAGGHRLALRREDRAVGFEQVRALHALRARPRADESPTLDSLKAVFRVVVDVDPASSGNAQSKSRGRRPRRALTRGRDLEEVQVTGRSVPNRSPLAIRKTGVADLSRGTGDGDLGGAGACWGSSPRAAFSRSGTLCDHL